MSPSAGRGRWGLGLYGLAVALAAALLGLPWVLGGSAQRAQQGLHDELLRTLPPGAILEDQYQRGWFRSRSGLELEIQPATGSRDSARLRIDSLIEQGPLHWLSSGWPPALARVRSEVRLSDPSIPLPPLQVVTDLNARGQGLARFSLPSGPGAGAQGPYRLRHGELRGSLQFEPPPGALSLRLDLSELELGDTGGSPVQLQGLALSGEVRPAAWPRTEDRGGSPPGPAQVRPVDRGSGVAPWAGDTAGYPLAGPLDLDLDLSLRTLSVGQVAYQRARVIAAAERLDTSTLGELGQALGLLSPGVGPPTLRRLMGAALLAQLLPRLATTEPQINVHSARVETPDGPLEAHLNLGLDGGDPSGTSPRAGRGGIGNWMRTLRADGEISVPEPLARRWLDARAGPGTQGSGGRTPPRAQTLQAWLDEGWVSLRGGQVTSAFRFADGLLTVNGKTVPLLALPTVGPW